MSYFEKYQKYKLKYLDLQNQYKIMLNGGNDSNKTIISLICTHSARLRCLMTDIAREEIDVIQKKVGVKEIRFKNVSISKMVVNKTGATLEMVFSGLISKENRKGVYFTTGKDTDTNYMEGDVLFPSLKISLDKLSLTDKIIGEKTYIFYIIRHGEGIHNEAKAQEKIAAFVKGLVTTKENEFTDAPLTNKGNNDAKEAGKILKELFGVKNIDYIFSSKLRRTRQTLKNILEYFSTANLPGKIIVLPCSDELHYRKEGKCDANLPLITNPENIQKCYDKQKKVGLDKEDCSSITISSIGLSMIVDWNKFTAFDNNKKCSNTNMIKEAIEIINNDKK